MAKTPKILNAHAKKRAEERYGVNLNKHARREIVQMIKSQQADFVSKQSNNRSLWRVTYQGEPLNVVYDRQRGTMCTVLPKDAKEFQQAEGSQPRRTNWSSAYQRREVTQELTDLWIEDEEK